MLSRCELITANPDSNVPLTLTRCFILMASKKRRSRTAASTDLALFCGGNIKQQPPLVPPPHTHQFSGQHIAHPVNTVPETSGDTEPWPSRRKRWVTDTDRQGGNKQLYNTNSATYNTYNDVMVGRAQDQQHTMMMGQLTRGHHDAAFFGGDAHLARGGCTLLTPYMAPEALPVNPQTLPIYTHDLPIGLQDLHVAPPAFPVAPHQIFPLDTLSAQYHTAIQGGLCPWFTDSYNLISPWVAPFAPQAAPAIYNFIRNDCPRHQVMGSYKDVTAPQSQHGQPSPSVMVPNACQTQVGPSTMQTMDTALHNFETSNNQYSVCAANPPYGLNAHSLSRPKAGERKGPSRRRQKNKSIDTSRTTAVIVPIASPAAITNQFSNISSDCVRYQDMGLYNGMDPESQHCQTFSGIMIPSAGQRELCSSSTQREDTILYSNEAPAAKPTYDLNLHAVICSEAKDRKSDAPWQKQIKSIGTLHRSSITAPIAPPADFIDQLNTSRNEGVQQDMNLYNVMDLEAQICQAFSGIIAPSVCQRDVQSSSTLTANAMVQHFETLSNCYSTSASKPPYGLKLHITSKSEAEESNRDGKWKQQTNSMDTSPMAFIDTLNTVRNKGVLHEYFGLCNLMDQGSHCSQSPSGIVVPSAFHSSTDAVLQKSKESATKPTYTLNVHGVIWSEAEEIKSTAEDQQQTKFMDTLQPNTNTASIAPYVSLIEEVNSIKDAGVSHQVMDLYNTIPPESQFCQSFSSTVDPSAGQREPQGANAIVNHFGASSNNLSVSSNLKVQAETKSVAKERKSPVKLQQNPKSTHISIPSITVNAPYGFTIKNIQEKQKFFNRVYKSVAWKLVSVGGFRLHLNHAELLNACIEYWKSTLDIQFYPLKGVTNIPLKTINEKYIMCEFRCQSVCLGMGFGTTEDFAKVAAARKAMKGFLKTKVVVKIWKRKLFGDEIEDLALCGEDI